MIHKVMWQRLTSASINYILLNQMKIAKDLLMINSQPTQMKMTQAVSRKLRSVECFKRRIKKASCLNLNWKRKNHRNLRRQSKNFFTRNLPSKLLDQCCHLNTNPFRRIILTFHNTNVVINKSATSQVSVGLKKGINPPIVKQEFPTSLFLKSIRNRKIYHRSTIFRV